VTRPRSSDAQRGGRYAVTAACTAAAAGVLTQWRIQDVSQPLDPGDDQDPTVASATIACDGRPHSTTAVMAVTGPVTITVDQDPVHGPERFWAVVNPAG